MSIGFTLSVLVIATAFYAIVGRFTNNRNTDQPTT